MLLNSKSLVKVSQDTYSPGPLRRGADQEQNLAEAFCARHPEFARLSHMELVTLAATYVGPERRAECAALEDAGVPSDWHMPFDGEAEES